jgi:hypothetical protein
LRRRFRVKKISFEFSRIIHKLSTRYPQEIHKLAGLLASGGQFLSSDERSITPEAGEFG